jgi:hypothetical protein
LDIYLNKKSQQLKFPGRIITDKSLFSLNYSNCNGVVLLGENFSGLSHYSTQIKKSEDYLPFLIEEIKSKKENKLVAIIFGGDKQHLKNNREILKNYNIPIVAEYCDEMDDLPLKPLNILQGSKDIFIDNFSKEVFLETRWGAKQIWPIK